MPGALGFANYTDIIAERMERFAEFARKLIAHPEKGRALEAIVAGAIRTLLPKRYSMGSGFVVNSKRQISKQLDIVIYDEQTNTPIDFGERSAFSRLKASLLRSKLSIS